MVEGELDKEAVEKQRAIENLEYDLRAVITKHQVTDLHLATDILHAAMIRMALASTKTNQRAAQQLGIGKTTLYRKMDEYGISARPKD